MKATPESILSLAAKTATKISTFGLEQQAIDEASQNPSHPYWAAIKDSLKPAPSENGIDPRLEEWKKFYKDHLNLEVDFSGVKIPEKRKGFYRLIVVAQGLTQNQVYDACSKQFPCYKYADDLDADVPTNDRDTKQSYAIWVRERVEADKEHKSRSADDLKESEVEGITLLERMLFELKYFVETKNHLDLENWTLCAGSRSSGGSVPSAYWSGSKFYVNWYFASRAYPYLRCREVVTL